METLINSPDWLKKYPKPKYPTFGQRVNALRFAKGWTFSDLCVEARLRSDTLRAYERPWENREATSEVIERLAAALGTTSFYLLTGKGNP
jgi:transcriptional regulator with XRE-family HTH domain